MQPVHALVKWNAHTNFEPDTIGKHARVLHEKGAVWWGKISKTPPNGLLPAHLDQIRGQIANGVETHLYMYCPDQKSPSLHVGLIDHMLLEHPPQDGCIPVYYSTLAYSVYCWFRLIDIRRLTLEHINYLRTPDGHNFDPVSAQKYPMIVHETRTFALFGHDETYGARYFQLQRLYLSLQESIGMDPKLVFVLMPFDPRFEDYWQIGIKETIDSLNMNCVRADEILHNKSIIDIVNKNIRDARLVIADMTTSNANVFYELGYAYALEKDIILITQDRASVPFDLRHINNIEYKSATSLRTQLKPMVTQILGIT